MKRHAKKLPLQVESIRILKDVQLSKVDGGIGCLQSGSCSSKEAIVTCAQGQC